MNFFKNLWTNIKYSLFNRFTLKVKKLSDDAILPTYAKDGDACLDVYAVSDYNLPVKQTTIVKLGIAVDLPTNYELQVRARSGLSSKGLVISNGIGTVDSGYRGEIGIILYNSTSKVFKITKGDRVGQITVRKVPRVDIKEVSEISETDRGTGGFGSTGTN